MAKLKCKDCKYNSLMSHDGLKKGNFCTFKYNRGLADKYTTTSVARRVNQFCGNAGEYWKASWKARWSKIVSWVSDVFKSFN